MDSQTEQLPEELLALNLQDHEAPDQGDGREEAICKHEKREEPI